MASMDLLMPIWAPRSGPMFPSKTDLRSKISKPVFKSTTIFWPLETYLLVSSTLHGSTMFLLILYTSETFCSFAITSSFAFNRFRALILLANRFLSPASKHNLILQSAYNSVNQSVTQLENTWRFYGYTTRKMLNTNHLLS